MEQAPPTGTGSLMLSADYVSRFLTTQARFVVRDSALRTVMEGRCEQPFQLPAGVYAVSAVLPTGESDPQFVTIEPGRAHELTFDLPETLLEGQPTPPPPAAPASPEPEAAPGAGEATGRVMRGMGDWLREHLTSGTPAQTAPPAEAGPPGVSVVALHGAQVRLADESGWTLVPVDPVRSVPTMTLDVDGRRCTVSLPVNPGGVFPLDSCRVIVERAPAGPVIRTLFDPGRLVSRAVAGLAETHQVGSVSDPLELATQLLVSKYDDPAGAALGGLTLHRFGRLAEREAWVDNLVAAAPWLPDAVVLRVALDAEHPDPDVRAHALSSLFTVASERPLFSDGLSLALDLLRRWPEPGGDEEAREQRRQLRRDALAGLGELAAYVDFSVLAVTDWRSP